MSRHSMVPRTERDISGIKPHSGSSRSHGDMEIPLGITTRENNNAFTPSKPAAAPTTTRTTPPSIPLLEAASLATLYLKSTPPTTSPPFRNEAALGSTFVRRQASRTAYIIYSCGRGLFIYYGGMALLNRGIINVHPGSPEFENAADALWVRVIMYEPQFRQPWEDAAKEIKVALDAKEISPMDLLQARGLPKRKGGYEAWAAGAAEELLQRVIEKWTRERGQSNNLSEAGVTEDPQATTEATTDESEAPKADNTQRSSQTGPTPPVTPLPHRHRAPAAYPPTALTPQSMPPRGRDSLHTIAEFDENNSEGEEIVSSAVTRKLTPLKAKIVDVKVKH